MATATYKRPETPVLNRFFESFAERIDTALNGRLGAMLQSTTALTPPGGLFASNKSFGVNYAMQSTVTRDWTKAASNFAKFTIEEARERISSLIDGEFLVESLQELIDYLKDRSLALEGRILQGKSINFLVDTKTKQSLPAAQVHPSLSNSNTKSLELRGVVRKLVGSSDPTHVFDSWQAMEMVMDNSANGYGYTVSDNTGYLGKVYEYATNNADENMAIIRRARAEGVQLILPSANSADIHDLVPGMPILRASKSMKAADVHPSMDHARLTTVFGETMISAYKEMAKKAESFGHGETAPSRGQTAEIVSLKDFKARYATTKFEEVVAEDDDAMGFGGLAGVYDDTREIGLRRGSDMSGSLAVWDFDRKAEIDMSPNCLPEGEYKRYASDGSLEGYSYIGNKGEITHYDRERNLEKPVQAAPQKMHSDEEHDNSFGLRLRK